MRNIKPRINVVKVNEYNVSYYKATIKIGSYTSEVNDVIESESIRLAYISLHNYIRCVTQGWAAGEDYYKNIPLQLYARQETQIEDEKLAKIDKVDDYFTEAAVARLLDPEPVIPDHCVATSNLPWWKRIFRV